MKTRRHHNNKGLRQVKRGKTRDQVAAIAKRLGIPLQRATEERRDVDG
jgi:outer membrane protein assembly factor BamE (lipoprotein component of BamABCDE complex)